MPAASDEAAERRLFGRHWVDVKTLRIEPFRKRNDLVRLDRDAAEGMNVAFNVVFEVAIIDRVRKSHEWFLSGLGAGISRVFPTGASFAFH